MLTHWLVESLLYTTSLMPVAFFFARGCCCCVICSDAFGRSDGTDISTGSACGWTEVSGSWSIASGELTNSGTGLVICNTDHPDSNITANVQVDFKNDTGGGKTVDIVAGYVDANNHYMARYTIQGATSKVEIIKRTGGVDGSAIATSAAFTMNTDTWYTGAVCVTQDGNISAYIDGTVKASTTTAQTITGTKVGMNIKFGGSVTTFDNFIFKKSYNQSGATTCDGCTPNCTQCAAGTVPHLIQAEIGGAVAGLSCTQEQCDAAINATWILSYGSPPDVSGALCSWWYDVDPDSCGIRWWRFRLTSSTNSELYAPTVDGNGPNWYYDDAAGISCDFVNFDSWTAFIGHGGPCDHSALTAQITGIL